MVSAQGLLKLSATRLTPLTNTKGRCGRRHVRSDSRPPFSLWTEIAVRTTTDTRRLSHAQPKVIVARKSLKSTGQHPRRLLHSQTFHSHFIFIGLDSDQKHLFSHTNSNSCDIFKRVAAQAVARDEGVLSEKSGLHTAPLVLQTASAGPEAVCFEFRHFCRRESVQTDPNAMWLVSPDVRSTYSEDGAVLLDIRKGLCYSLNPVAARVWSTVEASPSGVDLRGLVDVMETHYTISRDQLERDVNEYLSKLENIGLVQRNGLFHESKAAGARG